MQYYGILTFSFWTNSFKVYNAFQVVEVVELGVLNYLGLPRWWNRWWHVVTLTHYKTTRKTRDVDDVGHGNDDNVGHLSQGTLSMINRRPGRPVRFHCSDDPCTQYLINVNYRSYIPVITGTSWDIIMIPLPRATWYFGSITELGSSKNGVNPYNHPKCPLAPTIAGCIIIFLTPHATRSSPFITWFINPINYRYIYMP